MSRLHETIVSRTTVHAYRRDDLPAGALDRGLRAAVAAPNHRLTEPWRFTVVGRETRRALVEIAVELKAAKRGSDADGALRDRIAAKILDPAALVVVRQVLDDDPAVAREDYAAVACAIQNLMLALHAEGVGSKWSTGAVTRDPRTLRHLGIDDGERVVGFVWVGLPRAPSDKPRRRREIEELIRRLP